MQKALSLFGRKTPKHRPFKDYYTEWITTLQKTLLPLLRQSLSSNSSSSSTLLSKHVEMIQHHFQSYYDALDTASSNDVAQLLYPDWRNSLETPFLWLGDLHPYLFAKLLRSFLDDVSDEDGEEVDDGGSVIRTGELSELLDKNWHVVMAWNSPSKSLMTRIDEIERGLRLIVPALATRARDAQIGFIVAVGGDWGKREGRVEEGKAAIRVGLEAQMDEMVSVFVDANRVRRSVLSEIISATTVYQAGFFLEGLAQFLVGFRDPKLVAEFKRCKFQIN